MKINEKFCPENLIDVVEYHKIMPNGRADLEETPVVTEHQLEIIVNEKPVMRVVCTPEHLSELVLGRLLSEGIIDGIRDIKLLHLCETGHQAKVFLKKELSFQKKEIQDVASCCTGNQVLAFSQEVYGMKKLPAASYQMPWVFRMAEYFAKGSPLHKKTVGTHSCIMAVEGEILCRMEDIGRHNALDKALGFGLLQEVPLSRAMLYTSGRVPLDMVEKVIRAGVPVLISKAVPTVQSIALAKEYGLTLITSAWPDMAKKW